MTRIARGVGKTLKWLLILSGLFVVAVVIAVIVGLGSAGEKSDRSSAQVDPKAFAALKIGTPASVVRARFGKPERTNVTEVQGFKQTCWYYGILSSKGSYQLCFEHSKLTAKNRY
jgi:hypothetical protein